MRTVTMLPTQSHSGVIPENAALLQGVRRVLEASGYSELQNVSIEIHQRTVLLRGLVSSYFQKPVAQELVKGGLGTFSLQNEIRVAPKGK